MSGKNTEIFLKKPERPGAGRIWCSAARMLRDEAGNVLPLRPQSARLLATLLASSGVVLSKDLLIEQVWGKTAVSDDSLSQCIADIRRALDDADHSILRNHARRGYSIAVSPGGPRDQDSRKYNFRVAVLLDGALANAQQVDAEIKAELESSLSYFSTLRVIDAGPRVGSTGRTAPGLCETSWATDTDYVVVLRVDAEDTRTLHLGARVVDGRSGVMVLSKATVLSGHRLERSDQLGILAKQIETTVLENAFQLAQENDQPTAADYYLQGIARNPDTAACNEQARAAFEMSRALDDRNPLVWAGLAETYFVDAFLQYTPDFDASIDLALAHVDSAIARGPRASRPAWIAGRIFYLLREWDLAERSFDRAISLNPFDADAHAMRGSFLLHVGRPQEAVLALKRSISLNPEVETRAHWALGAAYYNLGYYGKSVDALTEILIRRPSFMRPYRIVAAAYAMSGQEDKAATIRETKLSNDATNTLAEAEAYMCRTTRYRRDIDHLMLGFQKAGFAA